MRQFIQQNQHEVNLERTKLMLRTGPEELNQYQKQEEIKLSLLEQRRRRGIKIENDFPKDHLPFISIIVDIAAKMPNAPKKPKLKIKFTHKMFEEVYLKMYYDKFMQAYNRLAIEQRMKIIQQMKQQKKKEEVEIARPHEEQLHSQSDTD